MIKTGLDAPESGRLKHRSARTSRVVASDVYPHCWLTDIAPAGQARRWRTKMLHIVLTQPQLYIEF